MKQVDLGMVDCRSHSRQTVCIGMHVPDAGQQAQQAAPVLLGEHDQNVNNIP